MHLSTNPQGLRSSHTFGNERSPMKKPVIFGIVLIVFVCAFWVSGFIFNGDSHARQNSNTSAIVRTGDEIHEVFYGEAQYGFVSELNPLVADKGTGHVVEGISVAIVKIGDGLTTNTLERIAFVPSSEKVKVNDKVIVYLLTHRDGHTGQRNYTRMVKALPDDYHGF